MPPFTFHVTVTPPLEFTWRPGRTLSLSLTKKAHTVRELASVLLERLVELRVDSSQNGVIGVGHIEGTSQPEPSVTECRNMLINVRKHNN